MEGITALSANKASALREKVEVVVKKASEVVKPQKPVVSAVKPKEGGQGKGSEEIKPLSQSFVKIDDSLLALKVFDYNQDGIVDAEDAIEKYRSLLSYLEDRMLVGTKKEVKA